MERLAAFYEHADCLKAAETTARDLAAKGGNPTSERTRGIDTVTTRRTPAGFRVVTTHQTGRSAWSGFECWPDTVDPRAP